MLKVSETSLPGVRLVEPEVFGDRRGFLLERWNSDTYQAAGLAMHVVQVSHSSSIRNAIRGLHYQEPKAQGKLICVLTGTVYDVAVDIRRGSPLFGRHVGVELTADPPRQLWIPPGFAHGFAVMSERAELLYVITDNVYSAGSDRCIRWNDTDLAIAWPVRDPIISEKDGAAPALRDARHLPRFVI